MHFTSVAEGNVRSRFIVVKLFASAILKERIGFRTRAYRKYKVRIGGDLNNFTDKENDVSADGNALLVETQPPGSTRRRFTRNGIVGSAVVFSLGNRAAWGQAEPTCMSTLILESARPDGTFASTHPQGNNHIEADAIEILSRPDEQYIDGTKTCVPAASSSQPQGLSGGVLPDNSSGQGNGWGRTK